VAALPGCAADGPTEVEPPVLERDVEAPFQTDSLSYGLLPAPHGVPALVARIGISFTNPTGDTLRVLERCQDGPWMILEREVEGGWIQAWESAGPACIGLYREVPPGAGYDDTVHFFGGLRGSDHWPQFELDLLDGVYRLRWVEVVREFDPFAPAPQVEPVPEPLRVSNRFHLRVEP
jgi:hypothetical protein